MNGHTLTHCLCCASPDLTPILQLGTQPLANSYYDSAHLALSAPRYPLALNVCRNCRHCQLGFCVDRKVLFDHYTYVSGTSQTLQAYFAWFATQLASALPPGTRVLELAANDGSLIAQLQSRGLVCQGLDPAANIVAAARSCGLPVAQGYWPQDEGVVQGQFDAIIAMNVVAHVDDPHAFLAACAKRLAPGGVVLVQPSQARMIPNGEFDTCYHEHVSFFNAQSMAELARRSGLRLLGSPMARIHGDSPIHILAHPDTTTHAALDAFGQGSFAIAESLPRYEQQAGLYGPVAYEKFAARAASTLDGLSQQVAAQRAAGRRIVFVGAAAKAMVVLHASGIEPDLILDEAPQKIGRFPAGISVPVSALQACSGLDRPACFILSAWNFRDELARKIKSQAPPAGSVYFTYFPHLHETH